MISGEKNMRKWVFKKKMDLEMIETLGDFTVCGDPGFNFFQGWDLRTRSEFPQKCGIQNVKMRILTQKEQGSKQKTLSTNWTRSGFLSQKLLRNGGPYDRNATPFT